MFVILRFATFAIEEAIASTFASRLAATREKGKSHWLYRTQGPSHFSQTTSPKRMHFFCGHVLITFTPPLRVVEPVLDTKD